MTGISNTIGITSRVGKTIVNGSFNPGEPELKRILTLADGIVDALPNTNETSDSLRLINKAMELGGKEAKFISGDVLSLKTLSELSVVGNVTKAIGIVGTAITPFTELETSMNMFSQEEFNLIAQYSPEDLNKFAIGVTIASAADAASWGFVRSVVKTPSSLTRLIPGEDPSWTDSYDNTINNAINARSINDNILQPTWNAITGLFK